MLEASVKTTESKSEVYKSVSTENRPSNMKKSEYNSSNQGWLDSPKSNNNQYHYDENKS